MFLFLAFTCGAKIAFFGRCASDAGARLDGVWRWLPRGGGLVQINRGGSGGGRATWRRTRPDLWSLADQAGSGQWRSDSGAGFFFFNPCRGAGGCRASGGRLAAVLAPRRVAPRASGRRAAAGRVGQAAARQGPRPAVRPAHQKIKNIFQFLGGAAKAAGPASGAQKRTSLWVEKKEPLP